jgi:acetyl esterase
MEIQETNGIVFRSVAGHDLTLDACVPVHATKAPVVVLVHGGSFSGGHPSDLDVVCRAAARHGYAAFSVDYRTLPTRWPAQVDDVAAAIDWIGRPAQVAQFHSDPTRIGLVGASAGATISAQLVTHSPPTPVPSPSIRAVALLSGVYAAIDLSSTLTDVETQYFGCDVTTPACAQRARVIYAANWVRSTDPPMFIVNSTNELAPLGQARRFDAVLTAHRVPHELLIVPGSAHAEAVLGTDPAALPRLLAFLDRYLR